MENNEAVRVKMMDEALPHLAAGKSVILTLIDKQTWQSLEALGTVEFECGEWDADLFRCWFTILARGGISVRITTSTVTAQRPGQGAPVSLSR